MIRELVGGLAACAMLLVAFALFLAYATARYPELTPLPPNTVRAALGRPRRPVSSARDRARADATPASAPSSERDAPGPRPGANVEPERIEPSAEAGVLAEAKLDRLLQSFLR